MSYLGRMFFRKDAGNLIYKYELQGDIIPPTVEQDFETLSPLKDYNIESVKVIELDENDFELRKKAMTASGIRLDLSTEELIFDFSSEIIQEISLEARVNELETLVLQLSGVI